jgi:microcystin-dependent protein
MSNELKLKKEFLEFSSTDNQATASLNVGTIMLYAGPDLTNISSNFLLCDGGEYSSTVDNFKYNDLFNIIGNTYGGSAPNFKVPNLKGRIAIGAEKGQNKISENGQSKLEGGVNFIKPDHLKHRHNVSTDIKYEERDQNYDPYNDWWVGHRSPQKAYNSRNTTNNLKTNNTIENGPQENIYPKYCAINYIICYKV